MGDHNDGARPTLPYPERDHCGDIFGPTLTEELECGKSVRRASTESRPIDTNARRSYDSTRDRNGCRASELATKDFQDMLAFETDCWDVHESLKSIGACTHKIYGSWYRLRLAHCSRRFRCPCRSSQLVVAHEVTNVGTDRHLKNRRDVMILF
jgi:hypothetical protein